MPPWTDRSGRFAPLRATVFGLLFLPALWLGLEASRHMLGARPTTEAIHQAGLWAIRLLALSLAVTPLRIASRAAKLAGVRRMLGVSVFAYVALHFALYIVDQHGDLVKVASEIVKRIYLLIGFVAFLGLAVLGATSFDRMIRRLGAPAWNRLHQIVYAVALLAIVHFFMQSKLDETEPFIMAGLFALLGLARLARKLQGDLTIVGTLICALAAAALTGLAEASWYAIKTGAPFDLVLGANWDFSLGVRPAWYALAGGFVLVSARLSRPLFTGRAARGESAANAIRAQAPAQQRNSA